MVTSIIELKRQKNKEAKSIFDVPRPFLKWAGGKRQLLSQIDPFLPSNYENYIEPFIGGGALFFYMLPENAVLIDNNEILIKCYQVIKNNVEDLIESLKKYKNESHYYYQIRNVDRLEEFQEWTDVEKVSRILYMNKCCYNGLYRVNSKGYFNVPFGKYKNPKFLDEENLIAVNQSLQNVELISDSFQLAKKYAQSGDFIYFDPPYHPLSATANFTGYTKDSFGKEDQTLLRDLFRELDHKGCQVMLSNSHSDFILDLYSDYHIEPVSAKRAINSDPTKRGEVKEVLIMNY